MSKLLVKDVLNKVIYKATIQTYKQNKSGNYGLCLDEGYSSDLKSSIWADLEVEHIDYDSYRQRVSIILEEKECMKLLKTKSTLELRNYLEYHKGYHFKFLPKDDEAIKQQLEIEKELIEEKFIYEVKYWGQVE